MYKAKKPSVTLVLFSYNQEQYIEDAVKGALSQDYSPLKIVLSDDFSSDNTFKLIEELSSTYRGDHKIECRRNEKNLGLIGHVNHIMANIDTELIVVAAGDDISLPQRVSKIVDAYLANGKPKLIFSKALQIDSHGNFLEGEVLKNVIDLSDFDAVLDSLDSVDMCIGLYLGASGAWTYELWEKYGDIKYSNCYEDLVMGFRAALEKSYHSINDPLLLYRCDSGVSSYKIKTVSGKISKRKRSIQLRLDLARQRSVDLNISFKSSSSYCVKKIKKQVEFLEIVMDIYESWPKFIYCLRENPSLALMIIFSELKYFLKHVVLKFGKYA
jgi:glycosyltransferase involved in cell wall biosynthesis